jgi:hypothetical protein
MWWPTRPANDAPDCQLEPIPGLKLFRDIIDEAATRVLCRYMNKCLHESKSTNTSEYGKRSRRGFGHVRYIEFNDFIFRQHANRDKQEAATILRNVIDAVVRHEGANVGNYLHTHITYIWYPPGVGLKFHIDDWREWPGPVFHIEYGSGERLGV